MDEVLKQLPLKAKEKHAANKKFFAKLKKKPPKNLDYVMQELHEAEFQRTDCLTVPIVARPQARSLPMQMCNGSQST